MERTQDQLVRVRAYRAWVHRMLGELERDLVAAHSSSVRRADLAYQLKLVRDLAEDLRRMQLFLEGLTLL